MRDGPLASWPRRCAMSYTNVFAHVRNNKLAAGPGFEPGQTDPKSVVLPLHNPALLHVPLTHYSMPACRWQLWAGCAPRPCIFFACSFVRYRAKMSKLGLSLTLLFRLRRAWYFMFSCQFFALARKKLTRTLIPLVLQAKVVIISRGCAHTARGSTPNPTTRSPRPARSRRPAPRWPRSRRTC